MLTSIQIDYQTRIKEGVNIINNKLKTPFDGVSIPREEALALAYVTSRFHLTDEFNSNRLILIFKNKLDNDFLI